MFFSLSHGLKWASINGSNLKLLKAWGEDLCLWLAKLLNRNTTIIKERLKFLCLVSNVGLERLKPKAITWTVRWFDWCNCKYGLWVDSGDVFNKLPNSYPKPMHLFHITVNGLLTMCLSLSQEMDPNTICKSATVIKHRKK